MIYADIVKEGKQMHAKHKESDLMSHFEDSAVIIKAFLMKRYKT
jgi:hypothetical protein